MSENNVIFKYWSSILVSLFLLVCAVYVAINGQNVVIQVFDNLDSNIAWLKMLKDNNLFFNYHEQVPFLHGIDRIYLYSPLKAYTWLYIIFPVYWAFVIGWFLKVTISVLGFVYLGKILHLNTDDFHKNIIVFCGFLYGLTPTFPTAAFHFASLPFLLGFLIEYYQQPNKKYGVFFLLYPAFSDFCFFGIFILGYLAVFIALNTMITKKVRAYKFYPFICLIAGYIITEWNLFYLILFSAEENLRSDTIFKTLPLIESLKQAVNAFISGQYHVISAHTAVVLPVCALYFLYLLYKKRTRICKDYYFWIVILLLLNSFIFGLDSYEYFRNFVSIALPPLKGFNFGRTIWLNPFLWYFAFAIALCRIDSNFKYTSDLKFYICIYALIALFCNNSLYNIVKYNYEYQLHKHQDLQTRQGIKEEHFSDGIISANREVTYADFYSEKLFDRIKQTLHYNGEWSVAYGFHPAVLEYNQIKTIDGYLSYYSLEYKKEFRKLIASKLEKDELTRRYFDNWGGRAYVFSETDTYKRVHTENEPKESVLSINIEVFKNLDGKYIFSVFKLNNATELNLKFIDVFEEKNSPYVIYVYELIG